MKKFNLERALAGDKVITREGETVTQLGYFEDLYVCADDFLVGVVAGHIQQWDEEGNFLGGGFCNSDDLFMAPVAYEGWLNVDSIGCTSIYDSKEDADLHAEEDRIMCIDLSVYEMGHGIDEC